MEQSLLFIKKALEESRVKDEIYIPKIWNIYGVPGIERSDRRGEILVDRREFLLSAVKHILSSPVTVLPGGIESAVIYSMLPRAFSAWNHHGEQTEGGTLLKSMALLPLLRDMGIDVIYLLPVFEMSREALKSELPSPYSIRDIKKIDGSLHEDILEGITAEQEFSAFTEAAHRLGMKVMLDFVFRTCGRDNVLIREHPDWFYWIKSECSETLRSPSIEGREQLVVGEDNIEELYKSKDMERFLSCFAQPPSGESWKAILSEYDRTGELLSRITSRRLGIVTLTGFADTINDDQPPWTDVTYYKYYFEQNKKTERLANTSKYPPFIAQDGVKCSVFPGEAPNTQLWEYIAGVIPYYIDSYGIDGARIDMAHALPSQLNDTIIRTIKSIKPDFILWSEEFFSENSKKAKKQGYTFILGGVFFCWQDYPGKAFEDGLSKALDSELPVTAALETPDTPRILTTLGSVEAVKEAVSRIFSMPGAVPMINCGSELCERQPMNLGLMNDENGKFVLSEDDPMYGRLAFFDSFRFNWLSKEADGMREHIAKCAEKYREKKRQG